jgi:hypothetical protein
MWVRSVRGKDLAGETDGRINQEAQGVQACFWPEFLAGKGRLEADNALDACLLLKAPYE